jgi:putative CRISPR-associated protein (TIGR02619 family)
MKTFICTVGTSICTGTGLDLGHFAKRKLDEWDALLEDIAVAEQFAIEAMNRMSEKEIPRVSAEINSLLKMGLSGADRVVLLATETIDGKLCAELVQRMLKTRKLCSSVELKVIEGLQAQDGKRFRQEGLKNLMAYIARFENSDVVFNPTGGFKSVVPYITLAGMLFNKPVKYIHEYSDDLMTLVNIPITVDDELIFFVEDKLQRIERDSCMTKKEWQMGIEYHNTRFDCLIEEEAGQITMSGLGILLWERFKTIHPPELERSLLRTDKKKIKLGAISHHGSEMLESMAKKLIGSPYVEEIPNSAPFKPESSVWIIALEEVQATSELQLKQDVPAHCYCIFTNIKKDAGYSFYIKTTARNSSENKRIAELLTQRYFQG